MAKKSLNRNANRCECKANLMNAKSPTRMNREATFAKKPHFLGAREEEPSRFALTVVHNKMHGTALTLTSLSDQCTVEIERASFLTFQKLLKSKSVPSEVVLS